MENFTIDNPTILHFGKGAIKNLRNIIPYYGKRVMLVYGKGSVKTNGIYDDIFHELNAINAEVVEYEGIKPNPVVEDVDAAAETGKQFKPDVILAVGGGSVLDSAKIISITIPVDHSGWKFMAGEAKPQKAIPVVTVLTLAATGSEMNPYAVLQNHNTQQKVGWGHKLTYPAHSLLDPEYTFSVSRDYTAYGVIDLVAHALENYFGDGEASLSDRFVFSIIQEAMEYGPELLKNLQDYRLREKIMYAATMALNGLTMYGRKSGDWGVHDIGHVLSLLYDLPHGSTLSVAYPAWLKVMKERIPERIAELGNALFGVNTANETITGLEEFFIRIKCPVRLIEAGTEREKEAEIMQMMLQNCVGGAHHKLSADETKRIVELMY